eukprot:jgi/Mesen1/3700/ME000202S02795
MAGQEGSAPSILQWLSHHGVDYSRAIRHPFLESAQDYLFVRSLVRFVASTLLKLPQKNYDDAGATSTSPPGDFEVLLGSLSALDAELKWFKELASKRGVQLAGLQPLEANVWYMRYLEELSGPAVPYEVALTALWAVELVYCEAWSRCTERGAHTPADLQECCQRWGNPEFASYCSLLGVTAQRALEGAAARGQEGERERGCSRGVFVEAKEAFLKVLRLEVAFWDMSTDGDDS